MEQSYTFQWSWWWWGCWRCPQEINGPCCSWSPSNHTVGAATVLTSVVYLTAQLPVLSPGLLSGSIWSEAMASPPYWDPGDYKHRKSPAQYDPPSCKLSKMQMCVSSAWVKLQPVFLLLAMPNLILSPRWYTWGPDMCCVGSGRLCTELALPGYTASSSPSHMLLPA